MASKKAASKSSHQVLLLGGLVVGALVLGLTVVSVKKPVNYTPRAYVQSDDKTIDGSLNHPPAISGSTFSTIRCQPNQICRHTFVGTDSDLYDNLTFTVDFLPPNLTLGTCENSQTLTGNKKISCDLAGTPAKPGIYKLLATLNDGANPPVTKTFTLNVD